MKATIKLENGQEIKAELDDETIAKLKVEKKPWKPEDGERYYYVDSDAAVRYCPYIDCTDTDMGRYSIGNVFKTEADAEKAAKWLKARYELEQTSDFKPDWGDQYENKYYVYIGCGTLAVGCIWTGKSGYRPAYYQSWGEAKKSINDHEDAWLTFYGVER